MKRRDFIRVMGFSGGAFFLPPFLTMSDAVLAQEFWLDDLSKFEDIRLKLLAYAMLAPSAHNTQPWLIKLEAKQQFSLFVDQDRLLPETDPPARQIHISQGSFIENLDIAAQAFGYHMQVNYFPEGEYANNTIENKAVARFNLLENKNTQVDRLFKHIVARSSNKRIYSNTPLSNEHIQSIATLSTNDDLNLTVSNDKHLLQYLPPMLTQAMTIEVSKQQRDLETIRMFRFNNDEIEKYRDGLSIAQTGKTGLMKWMIERFFISREKAKADDSKFAEQAVNLTERQAASTQAFAWITSKTNTRLDQVLAGRLYERLNLLTTSLNVAQHPMSQILEEYADMAELKAKFYERLNINSGETVQMLVRLGYASEIPHTPRRPVNSVLL
ncbi:MAG: twin-arginine translocation pathway signal protein [Gammaproteobacteria bacterium]|nr:twin-arginine translocation pathway signal protein [Gammaproteobacteria bacterium]MDH5730515.1 twin-arginine translocation pathway signal protein [Gammaproteobacteria bacterium]